MNVENLIIADGQACPSQDDDNCLSDACYRGDGDGTYICCPGGNYYINCAATVYCDSYPDGACGFWNIVLTAS